MLSNPIDTFGNWNALRNAAITYAQSFAPDFERYEYAMLDQDGWIEVMPLAFPDQPEVWKEFENYWEEIGEFPDAKFIKVLQEAEMIVFGRKIEE